MRAKRICLGISAQKRLLRLVRNMLKEKIKNVFIGVLIFAAVFAVLFCIAEIITRKVYKISTEDFVAHVDNFGWQMKPNMDGTFQYRTIMSHVTTNSKGLRDKEYNYEKPENTKRVLILGDSMMNALSVNDDQTTDAVLENYLNQHTTSTEVINSGIFGWGTAQEYSFLKLEGLKYEPDVVAMFFVINDIVENYDIAGRKKCSALYYTLDESGELVQHKVEESKEELDQQKAESLKKGGTMSRFKLFLENSAFFTELKTRISYVRPLQDAFVALGLRKEDKIIPSMIQVYHSSFNDDFPQHWALTEKLIREAAKEAKNANAEFLLVQIPTLAVYDEEYLRAALYASHNEDELNNFDFGKVTKEFERIAASDDNIDFIDLTPKFEASKESTTFYPVDQHWNKKGHELAVEAIRDKILEYLTK